jgi:hypothetical protein
MFLAAFSFPAESSQLEAPAALDRLCLHAEPELEAPAPLPGAELFEAELEAEFAALPPPGCF